MTYDLEPIYSRLVEERGYDPLYPDIPLHDWLRMTVQLLTIEGE